jgi:putative inorganic carbon (hco3(-)) transporter
VPIALRRGLPLGAILAILVALALAAGARYGLATGALAPLALLVLGAAIYIVWHIEPRYTLTLALLATPFASNWQQLGIPGQLAPERLLLIAGVAVVLLRGPGIRDRPRLRLEWVHWSMVAVSLYVAASALASHTLFVKAPGIQLLETFGILPFLTFTVAPLAFPTARERSTLLKGLVGLGVYLSLTTLFEMAGPKSLVFPSYILNPNYGIHYGRGRGPFVEAVSNGFALYVCAIACLIAVRLWQGKGWRIFAGAVAALCAVGVLLTLERSVWIGAAAGTLVTMLVIPSLRRRLVPILLVGVACGGLAVALVPGLSEKIGERAGDKETVWDRENMYAIAERMIEARPVFGFGWNRYLENNAPYLRESTSYPLTATTLDIHNTLLAYGVELGVVGLALWLLTILMGVGGALLTRGPPSLESWRAGLLALFVFFIIVQNAVPPSQVFDGLVLWLWTGVVWRGRYPDPEPDEDGTPIDAWEARAVDTEPWPPAAGGTWRQIELGWRREAATKRRSDAEPTAG